MPRTIDQGFSDYLQKLTPSDAETESAKNHRASIEECLQNTLGMTRFFRTGSFGNGTSVFGYSDVDYFVEFPVTMLKKDSSKSLKAIQEALARTFWDTDITVESPAVRLHFSNGKEITEVVPADKLQDGKWGAIYDIPSPNNAWMKSSPEAHKAFVKYWDGQLENKVRPLIRFLKSWKFENQVPISSFYLELAIAAYSKAEAEAKRGIQYHVDIYCMLNQLLRNNLADMTDPMGISGQIPACASTQQYADALSKLRSGASAATNAFESARKNNLSDAFEYWKQMFGDSFPNYYI